MNIGNKLLAASLLITGLALMTASGVANAQAQQRTARIWDTPFGTHVANLPTAAFVDPACGTNGGPPSLQLRGFEEFARCPEETETGLREVWFIYDDTLEYVGLARREPAQYMATSMLRQPVILSYLIDNDGRVQGYRIFTDQRAEAELRGDAHGLVVPFRARVGMRGWECADLPQVEGELPFRGLYVKQLCEKEFDGRRGTTEARLYYKDGQTRIDPFNNSLRVNEFESWARVEIVQVEPLPAAELDRLDAAAAPPILAGPPLSDPREAFLSGQTIDCPGCDLAGVDLRRWDLTGADLSGVNFHEAILHRTILRQANLAGANLSGANLNRADLTFANLRNANLGNAMLWQVDAARADFSGADLTYVYMGRARLSLANFEDATLNQADLGEARMNDANLANATLNDAYLHLTVLFRANMRGVAAESATFTHAGLRDVDLTGAVLRGADLERADLAGADLTNADFSGSRLLSASLHETIQEGTVFAGAQMPDNSLGR
jgi:uncharacterized protein YjbI with pentapeptide repeats